MRNDDMSETWKNEQIQKNMRKRLRICIFLNAMQKNNNFNTVQYVQKKYEKFVRFVHTYSVSHGIIITVKTPQYIIQFLLYPIVKIPSPKKTAFEAVFFILFSLIQNNQKRVILFVRFVHTFAGVHAIIITVKTPQYIIQFLLYPIVKIPSPKRQRSKLSFLLSEIIQKFYSERYFPMMNRVYNSWKQEGRHEKNK